MWWDIVSWWKLIHENFKTFIFYEEKGKLALIIINARASVIFSCLVPPVWWETMLSIHETMDCCRCRLCWRSFFFFYNFQPLKVSSFRIFSFLFFFLPLMCITTTYSLGFTFVRLGVVAVFITSFGQIIIFWIAFVGRDRIWRFWIRLIDISIVKLV